MSSRLQRTLPGLALLGGLVAVWWWLSTVLGPLRLPSPARVLSTAWSSFFHSRALAAQMGGGAVSGLSIHLGSSLLKFVVGVGLGLLAGSLIGLAVSFDRRVAWTLDVPMAMLRAVPPLALIPFMLIWFGTGPVAQVALLAIYVALISMASTANAVSNIPRQYARYASTMGAGRTRIFRDVVLPGIVPEMLGGLRVLLAFSWGLLVVGELLGGQYGIGRVLALLVPLLRTAEIMATVLWAVVIAIVMDRLVVWLHGRLTDWAASSTADVA